ncbi:MAG: phospholipid carrier-dependent glycosyltransferase [bacterium]
MSVVKKIAPVFCLLWLLAGIHTFSAFFSIPFAYPVWSSLIFAVIAFSVFSMGGRICGLLGLATGLRLEMALSMSLGLAALNYSLNLLGFLNLLYPWTAVLVIALFFFCGKLPDFAVLRGSRSPGRILLLPALLILAAAFFVSWAPATLYDSLVYHMPIPEIYTLRHGIVPIPENLYSHFPQNAEMLFSLGILFGSDIVSRLMTWLAFASILAWVYAAGGEVWTMSGRSHIVCTNADGAQYPEKTTALALLLCASHTALWVLSCTAYVETFVALWVSAALMMFLRWIREPAESGNALKYAVLAGVFAGVGLGTKYYAGICAAGLFLFGLGKALSEKDGGRKKARALQAMALPAAAFLLFLPWALKNVLETGNPVFPFLYKLFPISGEGLYAEQAERYFRVLIGYGRSGTFLRDFLEFSWLTFSNPLRFGGGGGRAGRAGLGIGFCGGSADGSLRMEKASGPLAGRLLPSALVCMVHDGKSPALSAGHSARDGPAGRRRFHGAVEKYRQIFPGHPCRRTDFFPCLQNPSLRVSPEFSGCPQGPAGPHRQNRIPCREAQLLPVRSGRLIPAGGCQDTLCGRTAHLLCRREKRPHQFIQQERLLRTLRFLGGLAWRKEGSC